MKKNGYIQVPGGRVWYEVLGKTSQLPLIILHGGPGSASLYMSPLKALGRNRTIIFYDQLGCGQSDMPDDKNLWTVKRFTEELQHVVRHLKVKKYHILGHSWGAALAVSYALTKPSGLQSLVLADPYLSTPLWAKDATRLRKLLSAKTQKALDEYEKRGKIEPKEYKKIGTEFYKKFVVRLRGDRLAKFRKTRKTKDIGVYQYMWGPTEFAPTGTLKHFDLTLKLNKINTPTLFVCGKYDEATPLTVKYFQSLIPGAKVRIFKKSAHLPFWSEPNEFRRTIATFLDSVVVEEE